MKKYLFLFIFFPVWAWAQFPSEKTDAKLQRKLEALTASFQGDVGIYVRNLKTGKTAAIRPDSLFPTASMIKIPIMATMFDRIERGEFQYRDVWTYRDSLLYEGEDLLGSFKDGEMIEFAKVVMLMMTMSDNTASLWAQLMAGTGTRINALMASNGFLHTRVNSRTPGREAEKRKFGWGVTTPREMAELVVRIRQNRLVSAAASEEMYRALTRSFWNKEALSPLPPYVQAASKQGAVDRSRSEVVLVSAPSGDYVFCIITKNQTDTSWTHDNAGFKLLRDVSALLWQHFEPKNPWKPAAGEERYW